MKLILLLVLVFLLLAAVFIGCAQPSTPVTKVKTPSAEAVAPVPKAAQEQEWQNTLAEAKKEGTVFLYVSWSPPVRVALTEAFRNKFGINIEFMPFNQGADLVARANAEKAAGIYTADVFGVGAATILPLMKPEGLIGPIEPLLLLPEVKDTKAWNGGKFPFLDADKRAIAMVSIAQRYIMYNTEKIRKGEIITYRDVLKPQYKGKITMRDPSLAGAGTALLSLLGLRIWNLEEAKDFLRQLIVQQEVVMQRDARILVESVARGKFAVCLGPSADVFAEFLDAGAPVDVVIAKEGTAVSAAAGVLAVPVKFGNPHAAKVFINWLLTKEGQTVFARSFGVASMRVDVPSEGIPATFLIQPGEKLFLEDEEITLFKGEMTNIAKKIIEEAAKG